MKRVLLLCIGLAAFTRTYAEGTVPSSSLTDERQRTMSYLGELSAWKQQPGILVHECEKVDPPGAADRRAIYDQWTTKNHEALGRVDLYLQEIVPRLVPSETIKGADPVKALNASTFIQLSRPIYFMAPEKKLKLCQNFKDLPLLNSEKMEPILKEAFMSLDKWKEAHPK